MRYFKKGQLQYLTEFFYGASTAGNHALSEGIALVLCAEFFGVALVCFFQLLAGEVVGEVDESF